MKTINTRAQYKQDHSIIQYDVGIHTNTVQTRT